MKSGNGSDNAAAPIKPRRLRIRRSALSATFVTLVCLAAVDTIFPASKTWLLSLLVGDRSPSHAPPAFDWNEISASEHLHFHKCFDSFECAKLKLPLDYFNGTYPDHTVSIAITKVPAVVPSSDPHYGGPILINPGGPGGAGAGFALIVGKALQFIVDSDDPPSVAPPEAKYFDIIGFDPRGIGWTEPAAQCMLDQPSVWSWDLREGSEGLPGSSDAALGRLWSMTHAFGASCKVAGQDLHGPDIKQYMSTAFVARDMLEITEKHAEYVARELGHTTAKKAAKRPASYSTYVPGQSKLQYWGYSYGTYLGSTFASMFPNRVGRLILDGVVSEYDYNHSLGNGSLTDAEKALWSFYTFCFNSGPGQCPLATSNSTVTDIEERVQKIVQSLYHDPFPIISSNGPDFLTWSDVKMLFISSLYLPGIVFPFLAGILADIEAGGGSQLNQLAEAYHPLRVYSCPVDQAPENNLVESHIVSTISILCGEGYDQSDLTKDEFAEYWKLLESVSPTVGAYWSMLRMRCAGWNIRANYSFRGPFGANTSNPILFISNTADPVTPLRSGRYMSSLFPGSGLLISDHAGHCTLSTTDNCVWEHVKRYFQKGDLPLPGTVCIPPSSPFSLNSTSPDSPFYDPSLDGARSVMAQRDDMDYKQRRLHDVGVKLQKDVADSGVLDMNMPGGERMKRVVRFAMKSRDGRI